jgi:hypothetical protein
MLLVYPILVWLTIYSFVRLRRGCPEEHNNRTNDLFLVREIHWLSIVSMGWYSICTETAPNMMKDR